MEPGKGTNEFSLLLLNRYDCTDAQLLIHRIKEEEETIDHGCRKILATMVAGKFIVKSIIVIEKDPNIKEEKEIVVVGCMKNFQH